MEKRAAATFFSGKVVLCCYIRERQRKGYKRQVFQVHFQQSRPVALTQQKLLNRSPMSRRGCGWKGMNKCFCMSVCGTEKNTTLSVAKPNIVTVPEKILRNFAGTQDLLWARLHPPATPTEWTGMAGLFGSSRWGNWRSEERLFPSCLCWTKTGQTTETLPETDIQTDRNKSTSKYCCVRCRGSIDCFVCYLSYLPFISLTSQLLLEPYTALCTPPPDLSHSLQGRCRHLFRCLGDVCHFSGLEGWWVWDSVKRRWWEWVRWWIDGKRLGFVSLGCHDTEGQAELPVACDLR